MIFSFIKRIFCKHPKAQLIEITYDGDAIYECCNCGKRKTIGLKQRRNV